MIFLTWLSQMHESSWYILTRCVLITCAMLFSALVVLIFAGGTSVSSSLLQTYAAHTAASFVGGYKHLPIRWTLR